MLNLDHLTLKDDNSKNKIKVTSEVMYKLVEEIIENLIDSCMKEHSLKKSQTTKIVHDKINQLIEDKILVGDNYYFLQKIDKMINDKYSYVPKYQLEEYIKSRYNIDDNLFKKLMK